MKPFNPKPKACAYCGSKFTPTRPMQPVCSPICASRKVRGEMAKQRVEAAAKPVVTTIRRGVIAPVSGFTPAPKSAEPVRSERYRRLVAMLPCKFCGIAGHSQAAHPNTGKGAGMKTDDRLCFALCADRPGQRGCHSLFDQGALLDKATRRAVEPAWGADTRRQITAMGLWPESLPAWSEE